MGLSHRHGRMYAKFPCLIRGSGNHAAAFHTAANNDWQALQLRMIPLLYRSKKSIHIHMQNRWLHAATSVPIYCKQYNTEQLFCAIITSGKRKFNLSS